MRFQLEKGSKKHQCPGCGQKRFVRYVDTTDSAYAEHHFGRCDREQSCSYHLSPNQIQNLGAFTEVSSPNRSWFQPMDDEPDFIPETIVARTLNKPNQLLKVFGNQLGEDKVRKALSAYRVGAAKKWNGAVIFWQTDINGNVRSGQIIGYDGAGHRIKSPKPKISWAHTELRLTGHNLIQCFFGEHLLAGSNLPVAIVESAKTAIIASIVFPQFIWLSTNGKSGIRFDNVKATSVLKGRKVVLFPDLGAYDDWKDKAELLSARKVIVSELLEKHASKEDRAQGLDLCDYIERHYSIEESSQDEPKICWG